MSSNFQAELKESEVEIMCHMKKNFIQLKKNYCLVKRGGGKSGRDVLFGGG